MELLKRNHTGALPLGGHFLPRRAKIGDVPRMPRYQGSMLVDFKSVCYRLYTERRGEKMRPGAYSMKDFSKACIFYSSRRKKNTVLFRVRGVCRMCEGNFFLEISFWHSVQYFWVQLRYILSGYLKTPPLFFTISVINLSKFYFQLYKARQTRFLVSKF